MGDTFSVGLAAFGCRCALPGWVAPAVDDGLDDVFVGVGLDGWTSAGRPVDAGVGETGMDFASDDGDVELLLLVDEVPVADWLAETEFATDCANSGSLLSVVEGLGVAGLVEGLVNVDRGLTDGSTEGFDP